eukprot:1627538-Alexandrium_andersonii.AAC.1
MSASLVGSEMCIRDRPRRRWPTRRSAPPGLSRRAWRPSGARPRRPMRSCLLYTSDAADDM